MWCRKWNYSLMSTKRHKIHSQNIQQNRNQNSLGRQMRILIDNRRKNQYNQNSQSCIQLDIRCILHKNQYSQMNSRYNHHNFQNIHQNKNYKNYNFPYNHLNIQNIVHMKQCIQRNSYFYKNHQ